MNTQFELRVNGIPVLTGDATSILVVFNNCSGASFRYSTDPGRYPEYLARMRDDLSPEIVIGNTMELRVYGKVHVSCKIGDETRVTDCDFWQPRQDAAPNPVRNDGAQRVHQDGAVIQTSKSPGMGC